MGFRFRRTVKLATGARLNLSKGGPSVSFGRRGARVTVGKDRITKTVGIPGTGVSYTDTDRIGGKKKSGRKRKNQSSENYNDIVGIDSSGDGSELDNVKQKSTGCFTLVLSVIILLAAISTSLYFM